MPNHLLVKNILIAAAVCVIVTAVAIYSYGLGDPQKWRIPPGPETGDGAWMLNLLEANAAGDYKPFHFFIRKELAAPYSANFSDWPLGLPFEIYPAGWLIKGFGLAIGTNLYLILCHLAAALSMFFGLRFVKCKSLWAMVFGVAFGLCPYLFSRNFDHITLVNTAYLIPIICAASWYFFNNSPIVCGRRYHIFLLLLSFFIGTKTPYYSAPYLWVLCAAGAFWWVNLKIFRPLFFFGSAVATFIFGFLISLAPYFLYAFYEGKNFQAVNRAYSNLQIVALRPIEMFLPGSHSAIPILKQISAFYENQCIFRNSMQACESMAAYLGLLGCLGFLTLVGTSVYFILSKQQFRISGWFWFALFLIAFSVVGGINGFLGLGKFYFLRATNRYSIFVLAISLFYLALLLSSHPVFLRRSNRWMISAVFLFFACAEPTLPRFLQKKTEPGSSVSKFESDKKFAMALESFLPDGAMIFNIPVIQLPERGSYAHFRPTLHTNTIRYSFGAFAGRARDTWQLEVEKLPPNEMVDKLKYYGFSGILVYRGADLSDYQQEAAKQICNFLSQNNFSSIVSNAGDFEFFAFNPNPNPVFPPALPMYVNNWWSTRIQPEGFTNDSEGEDSGWRWSTNASAMVEIFNEQPVPRRLSLRGRAIGTRESELQIFVKEKMVFSGKISSNAPVEFSTESIEVAGHKALRFEFKSDRKPFVQEGRKFSFAVAYLEASWE